MTCMTAGDLGKARWRKKRRDCPRQTRRRRVPSGLLLTQTCWATHSFTTHTDVHKSSVFLLYATEC
ncbi:hypothetical protein PISMIDRAFT_681076 [Pisolithus microcarpus 441]|uniref:Uncharacterized protein n=1 Tax=Pisolithus microcarpus 441 TaxID=765257 RepID=A0A0C9YA82_9AGAM|nr:hypothetical protein PISMIDRAFT_681076 [Pisolithus microcarpus 441]